MIRLLLAASTLALGASASAQTLGDLDADADGMVSIDEWTTGMAADGSRFGALDEDASGGVSQPELANVMFKRFDSNGDAQIADDEYLEAYGADAPPLDEHDADANGVLNEVEFAESLGFVDYDLDESGDLSSEEFAGVEFRRFDTDQDEMLSEEELSFYQDMMGQTAE